MKMIPQSTPKQLKLRAKKLRLNYLATDNLVLKATLPVNCLQM
jgi:hypothetical protein